MKYLSLFLFASSLIGRPVCAEGTFFEFPPVIEHSMQSNLTDLGMVWGVSVGMYYFSQPKTVTEEGSLTNYRRNFGRTVQFDNDLEIWNWVVHPYSGSQLYLYYRLRSYSPLEAFKMSFLSSALFEYTIEVYTEPASLEDLINTPILGSALGLFFERASAPLINSSQWWKRVLGFAMNPLALLSTYGGVQLVMNPQLSKDQVGLSVVGRF